MQLRLYHLTWFAVFTATLDYRFFTDTPGIPSVSFLHIEGIVLLFALVVLSGTKPAFARKNGVLMREGRWVLMYFLWACVASLWGILHSNYQSAAQYEDLLPSLFLFVAVILSVKSKADLQGLITAYKIGMVIELFFGASQALFGAPRPVPLNEGAQWKTDLTGAFVTNPEFLPTGLFTHPNGYALFCIPFVLLIVAEVRYQPHRNVGQLLMNIGLLLVLVLVLSKDYTKGAYAWIALGMIMIFLPAGLFRFRHILGWLILLGGIIGLTVLGLQEVDTMQSRYGLWQAAFATLENPMVLAFGNGNNAMLQQSLRFSNMYYPSSHNTFLDQAIVFGLPALLLYGAILIKSIRVAASLPGMLPVGERGTAIFLHAGIVALLGGFFFEPGMGGTMLQAQFFLLAAFTVVLHRGRHSHKGKLT